MKDLTQQLQTFIIRHSLIPNADLPVIVGLSGGADSVALLHLLVSLQYRCIPAHCNFRLRGDESDRDEQFSVEVAKSMGLVAETIHFDTTTYAQEHKLSIEMAARELRYNWFEQLRQKYGAGAIAVGHHLGDSIETVLLNLIRGTGLKGLTGIKVKNGFVIRPLLEITKEEITEYLSSCSLSYITDSSNLTNDYTRNKIRNQLIPVMQSINPSLYASFTNTLHHLNDSYSYQQQCLEDLKAELLHHRGENTVLSIPAIQQLRHKEFVLYEILSGYNFNSTQIDNILQSLDGISGKQFFAPEYMVLKDRDQLLISPRKSDSGTTMPVISYITYPRTPDTCILNRNDIVQLDADRIQFPLQLRHWQPGDRFFPLGLNKPKKVSDFLIDTKTDRNQKKHTFVLTTLTDGKETIVWLAGYRIDHRFRITDTTTTIVEISLSEI